MEDDEREDADREDWRGGIHQNDTCRYTPDQPERRVGDRAPGERPPSAAAIAAAFTPVVIRSSSGRESVRVCGRSIDVATDEAHAGREQPDEPGGVP
jgi:hypothetical protein